MRPPKALYSLILLLGLLQIHANLRSAVLCANPGAQGAGGVLAGTVNSYFQGTVNAPAGATSITVGARAGAAVNIAVGDLILVIQMQDGTLNSTNTDAYGDGLAGDPGWGSTAVTSAG